MTVTAGSNKVILQGDGATGPPGMPFSLGTSFIGVSAAFIEVILTDAAGVETVLSPSQFTLALTPGNPPNWGKGGTVAYPLTGPAIPVGSWLTVVRTLPLAQAITLQNQSSYGAYAASAETALDLETLELQQVSGDFSRALVAPVTDPDVNLVIPNFIQRALQMLGFDSLGQAIAAQPASALVSTAMQPVVAAATLAQARTLMGIDISSLLPIGMEAWWPGLGAAPALWLYEDGSQKNRVDFPELYNVIAPSLAAVVSNTSNAVTGIADTTGWAVGWPLEGTGIPGGTVIASVGVGTISMSNPATADATSIRVFPYGNGNGASTFTMPGPAGRAIAALDVAATTLAGGTTIGANVGDDTHTLIVDEIPTIIPAGTNSTPSINNQGGGVVREGTGPFTTTGLGTRWSTAPALALSGAPVFTGTPFGLGHPHDNVQPTTIRRLMIYAGR